MGEHLCRIEVVLGAGELVQLPVELGQPDVEVGGGARVGLTICGGSLQAPLVELAGATGPAQGDPHVGEHDRGVQLVNQVSCGVQAAERRTEGLEGLRDVAVCPRGESEESASLPTDEVILGAGQIQGLAGVAHGSGHVAACLGQRRPVHRDGRRRRTQILGVHPLSRQVRVLCAGGEHCLCGPEPLFHGVEVA